MPENEEPESTVSRRTVLRNSAITSGVVFAGGTALAGSAAADHGESSHQADKVTATCEEGDCVSTMLDLRGLGNAKQEEFTAAYTVNVLVTGTCVNPANGKEHEPPGQNPANVTIETVAPVEVVNGRIQDTQEFCVTEEDVESPCPNDNWTHRIDDVDFVSVEVELLDSDGNVVRHVVDDTIDC
jgi:hypothetical protein